MNYNEIGFLSVNQWNKSSSWSYKGHTENQKLPEGSSSIVRVSGMTAGGRTSDKFIFDLFA